MAKKLILLLSFFSLLQASEMSTSSSSSSSSRSSSSENIEQVVLECKKNSLEKLDEEIKKLEEANPNLKEVDEIELVKLSDKKVFYFYYLLNKIKELVKRNRFKDASDIIKKFNKQNSVLVLSAVVYYLYKIIEITSKQLSNIIGFPEDILTIINSYVEPYQSEEIIILYGFNGGAGSRAWSPNSKYLALYSGYEVIIWDVNSWQKFKILKNYNGRVGCLAWSRDGKYLSLSFNKIILDTNTWKEIEIPIEPKSFCYTVMNTLSPDGKYLAVYTAENEIKILGKTYG